MDATTDQKPEKVRINQNNLYREEIFTDMTVGSLHQMTPEPLEPEESVV